MKTNFPYLITIIFWMPLFSFAGPNGGVGTASNPLNGDTTGAGSVARQREIYEADFAAKQAAAFENQRTYQEQLASLKLLQDNLDDLNRPNGGGLFRSVNGETNYIYDFLNNWSGVSGKVIQTLPDGILVKPEYGTDVFIQGYPFQTVDEQQLGECRAKEDGVYSYTAV